MYVNNTTDIFSENCIPGEASVAELEEIDLTNFKAPDLKTYPIWEIALKFSFYALAMLMDLVGNTIVILIIIVNRKMRTTTNILIANLAVSDILVACFCMWVHAGNSVTQHWPFERVFCVLSTFCQIVFLTASTLTLTVIALERFYVVWYPFKGKWSAIVTWSVIAVIWMAAVGTAAPQLVVRKMFVLHYRDKTLHMCLENWPKYYTDYNCDTYSSERKKYYVITAIVMYFIPIAVMLLAYSLIGFRLLHKKPIGLAPASGKLSHQEKAKRKITKMLVVVFVVFIVLWTPQQAIVLNLAIEQGNRSDPLKSVRYIALYLAYFSSAINPYLYAGLNENFRRGFVEAFKCLLVQRPNRIDPDDMGNHTQHRHRSAETSHNITMAGQNQLEPVQTVTQDQMLAVPSQDHFTSTSLNQAPQVNHVPDHCNGAPLGKSTKPGSGNQPLASVYLQESSL